MIPNYNDTTLLGMMIQAKRKSFALYDDRGKLKEKQFDITKRTSLANKIGCSIQKITDFETGKKLPSKEELKNIAVYFDISIDYFIFGSLENYIKNIFTVTIYDRNQNEDSRLTISLNNVKKLALLFEASMDTTYSTRYPKYLDVLNLAVEWKIIPFIDNSYNLIDITQKYGNDIWLLIAEQLYYNNFISNKNKYILLKKETNRLTQNGKRRITEYLYAK